MGLREEEGGGLEFQLGVMNRGQWERPFERGHDAFQRSLKAYPSIFLKFGC